MSPNPSAINYRDGRTRSIYVSIFLGDVYTPCGVITFNGAQDLAGFAYSPDYDGPPLDPINLNYRKSGTRHFSVNRKTNSDMLHRVFVDYLPGPWGISVLQAEHPEIKNLRAAERLHWFGTRTVGSLAFFVRHLSDEVPIHGIDRLESIRKRSVDFFLNKSPVLTSDRWELDGLSAHGGARPKCMFVDKSDGQWLAKFNIDTDVYNYARVEHAVAVLARKCGINAVETRALESAPGEDILFVRRFDKTSHGRPHKISAFALMREDIVRAQNEGDYRMLFDLIQQVCCNPEKEKEEMFRRMLFNIAVNNTDDHLKNFELLFSEEKNCFELSPAFDITVDPYPSPRITSVFGIARPTLGTETINHILRQLDFPIDLAYAIRDVIATEVRKWPELLDGQSLSTRSLDRLQRGFDRGLQDCDQQPSYTTPSGQSGTTHKFPRRET